MDWTRLHTSYFNDERVVALVAEHGYMAEAFWVRSIATCGRLEGPLQVPPRAETAVLARALGFYPEEAETVRKIADDAVALGLMVRREGASGVRWDLKNRSRWQVPKSLTPEYRREQKRRSRGGFVSGVSPRRHGDGSETSPPRGEERREDETRADTSPPSPPSSNGRRPDDGDLATVGKYLGRLRGDAKAWEAVTADELFEAGADFGFSPAQVASLLGDVWLWWRTAPKSKRWRSPAKGFRTWCRREQEKRGDGQQTIAGQSPAPPPPPPPKEARPAATSLRECDRDGCTEPAEPEGMLCMMHAAEEADEIAIGVAERLGIPLAEVDDDAIRLDAQIRRDAMRAKS